MQTGIEFHGRLSRSDRRPANPGQYDLLFQIFPKPGSQRVLWSETITQVEVRSGGFFDVVLGQGSPLKPDLFSQAPRWLGVRVVRSGRADNEHSPRVPILAEGIRLQAAMSVLSERLSFLENAFIGEDITGRSSRLRALPRRQQQLFSDLRSIQDRLSTLENSEETAVIQQQCRALAENLARLVAPSGRLTRIEDELEDLIGPHGDVVDLNERMDALEKRTLISASEGGDALAEALARFHTTLEDIQLRQERLEQVCQQLHESASGSDSRALTASFPVARKLQAGTIVILESGTLVPSRHHQDPGVVGVILSSDRRQATVAISGVVACQTVGAVSVGDILVASKEPGVAVAATSPPSIDAALGRALEEQSAGVGRVLVRLI